MPRHRPLVLALTAVLATATVAACARHAQRGAVIGAAGGAVAGGVIGAVAGSTAKGAIIGAAVGGAAGAIIGDQMDRRAAELRENIKGAKIERVGEGILVTFESGLLYDFDSDVVKPEAKRNFDELAKSFKAYRDSDLLIVGHTDNVGDDAYNQRLSERRADAARAYLVSQGVNASRMQVNGRGEVEPVTTNESATGRQQNRRVEVAIYASEALRREAQQKAALKPN